MSARDELEALRHVAAYRHGAGPKPMSRQVEFDGPHASALAAQAKRTWFVGPRSMTTASGVFEPIVMVHLWISQGTSSAPTAPIVEVVTYLGRGRIDVRVYFRDRRPRAMPDWCAICTF